MGFGILFIGYFLLLNFAYYSFTDAITGIILLYALYKLSTVNKGFKIASVFALAFTLLGIFEFFVQIAGMFTILPDLTVMRSVISIVRALTTGALTAYMLLGMQQVAKEVGLHALSEISGRLYILTFPVYGLKIGLEIFGFFSLDDIAVLAILSVVSIVLTMTLTVLILIRIYACYMRICMPEDKDLSEKKSKNDKGIIGAFRRHQEEKQKEYADYRLEKFKKAMEKKKKKGKK